jgi:hypothetical protein
MGKIGAGKVLSGGVIAWAVLVAEQAGIQMGWEAWMEMQVAAGLVPEGVLQWIRQPLQFSPAMLATKGAGAVMLAWLCAVASRRPGGGPGTSALAGFLAWGVMFFMTSLPAAILWPMMTTRTMLGAAGDLAGYLVAAALAGFMYRGLSGKAGGPARARRKR